MDNNQTKKEFPKNINTGNWSQGHIQGIAVDKAKGYIYYCFTTILVKAKFDGTVIGWVKGFLGHLGCIDYNEGDGKVYASLELKHDAIGAGIEKNTGIKIAEENAFYIAIIDVDKICRPDMDAEKDEVVKTAYLPIVVEWFDAILPDGKQHKYAVSGIDGTGVGPVFGEKNGTKKLMVACGIYGDNNREDNDFNIIMQYDIRAVNECALTPSQLAPHHSGLMPEEVYFMYTGNTDWGIQNLEYDEYTGNWLVAVYKGHKEQFRNYPFFIIDGSVKPRTDTVTYGETGKVLTLFNGGIYFNKGTTGMYSFGDGYYYFSHDYRNEDKTYASNIRLYRYDEKETFVLLEDK